MEPVAAPRLAADAAAAATNTDDALRSGAEAENQNENTPSATDTVISARSAGSTRGAKVRAKAAPKPPPSRTTAQTTAQSRSPERGSASPGSPGPAFCSPPLSALSSPAASICKRSMPLARRRLALTTHFIISGVKPVVVLNLISLKENNHCICNVRCNNICQRQGIRCSHEGTADGTRCRTNASSPL